MIDTPFYVENKYGLYFKLEVFELSFQDYGRLPRAYYLSIQVQSRHSGRIRRFFGVRTLDDLQSKRGMVVAT